MTPEERIKRLEALVAHLLGAPADHEVFGLVRAFYDEHKKKAKLWPFPAPKE
jgi:hypothetical protein